MVWYLPDLLPKRLSTICELRFLPTFQFVKSMSRFFKMKLKKDIS